MTDQNDPLEGFFAAAKRSDHAVSDDLMARVMADAAMVADGRSVAAAPDVARVSLWDRIMGAVGGWPALGSVMAAGLGGLWIGVAPPAGVEDWAAGVVGTTETVSFYLDIEETGLEALDG